MILGEVQKNESKIITTGTVISLTGYKIFH
jgi:hypothetical protein